MDIAEYSLWSMDPLTAAPYTALTYHRESPDLTQPVLLAASPMVQSIPVRFPIDQSSWISASVIPISSGIPSPSVSVSACACRGKSSTPSLVPSPSSSLSVFEPTPSPSKSSHSVSSVGNASSSSAKPSLSSSSSTVPVW